MKDKAGKEKKLVDMTPVSRLNYILYAGVFVLAAAVIYYTMAQYLLYIGGGGDSGISIEINSNAVETFADGFHPFIVVTAEAEEESLIELEIASSSYRTGYKSEEYVTNYTASIILPKTAYSTEFSITATAKTEDGREYTKTKKVRTKEAPDVMFKVG
jgi:hypothetical protein